MANAWEIVRARSPAVCGMIRHERNMMPSAKSPTMSRGWREFRRVIRLNNASTAAMAPSPRAHSAATSGTPRSETPPTTTQGRNVLITSAMPALNGTK
jgi:hypothetical protein